MLQRLTDTKNVVPATPPLAPPEDHRALRLRRWVFAGCVATSAIALLGLMALTLSPQGLSPVDLIILTLFGITLPWTVIGFWNAVIGLVLMRFTDEPAAAVNPYLVREPDWNRARTHASSKTAILSCIRNEDINRVVQNLDVMLGELAEGGVAQGFTLHVLSDTSWEHLFLDEERAFERLRLRWTGLIDVHYRRRPDNPGFKAGNIKEFLQAHANAYDFALVLDADSVMSARAILRLRQMMEDNPQLGILQSLVMGLPSASPFARIFQFGMRLGMRSYTLGSAWWQGDCGPYWGHNAFLRLAPFKAHCDLPILPGTGPMSGWVLSHDQVEAVLMRRGGYEVRVVPLEDGSFEENPPNILEFMRRDLRWCHGNLQYFRLLGLENLYAVSRIQLVLAILMFVGSPAWLGLVCISSLSYLAGYTGLEFRPDTGVFLFVAIMTMVFAPKLATIIDVLANPDLRARFGGTVKVMVSAVTEIVFSMLIAPVMAIAHTLFMAGLTLGRKGEWPAQFRDAAALPIGALAKKLWPQTLFGALGILWLTSALEIGNGAWLALPVIAGPAVILLVGSVTAWPQLGHAAHRLGLWSIPEETVPTDTMRALGLPVLVENGLAPSVVAEAARPEPVLEAAE